MPDQTRLTDERLRQLRDDEYVCTNENERSMAAELVIARQLLAAARLTDGDLTAMHRGLVDHARSQITVDNAVEQAGADTWMSGYSEGIEHALDTIRLRAHTAAPAPDGYTVLYRDTPGGASLTTASGAVVHPNRDGAEQALARRRDTGDHPRIEYVLAEVRVVRDA
jgi:hypothetical protein